MASRIISVTFETSTQSRPGAFSVPQAASTLLGISSDDPVELRVTWEGGKLELSTSLRSGLEVYPRSSDETTAGLEAIPARTPIMVTVWRGGEGGDGGREDDPPWNDTKFDSRLRESGGSVELVERLRRWAEERGVQTRYGNGKADGPLHFEFAHGGRRVGLAHLSASGGLGWHFEGNLDRVGSLRSRENRAAFVRRIGELFEVDRPEERAERWLEVGTKSLSPSQHDGLLLLLDDELELVKSSASPRLGKYQRTFGRVLSRFKELRPDATKTQAVLPQNWLEFSAGRTGFLFAWSMTEGSYFRSELYIDVGTQSENNRLFDTLRSRAAELEAQIGQPITWERLDKKRGCRVAVYYDHLQAEFESDDAMIQWAAQTMAKLVDVFRPIVRTI